MNEPGGTSSKTVSFGMAASAGAGFGAEAEVERVQPGPAPVVSPFVAMDPVEHLRASLNASLTDRINEALTDPLVCWFILQSRETRQAIAAAAVASLSPAAVETKS